MSSRPRAVGTWDEQIYRDINLTYRKKNVCPMIYTVTSMSPTDLSVYETVSN